MIPEFQRLVAEEMVFIEAFFAAVSRRGRTTVRSQTPVRRTNSPSCSCSPFASWRRRVCRERYKHLRWIDAPQIARPDRQGCDL